jgi:glucose/arabinose dehydrogenase
MMNTLLKQKLLNAVFFCWCCSLPALLNAAQTLQPVNGNDDMFKIVTIAKGLNHPWSLAFLPDGRLLVTERPGRLRIIDQSGSVSSPVRGLPRIKARGQGGLLDIALHPDYENNGWLYFSYVAESSEGMGTELARARLEGNQLVDLQVLFKLKPKSSGTRHFGGRIVFDADHHVYLTLGDRGERSRAQAINDHAGSLIRLRDDGSIPQDNVFSAMKNGLDHIYSYGHRNPQGMAINPASGVIWLHEHGPQGGDEINIIKSGKNYGWPVITYGVNYVIGTKIGEGTHKTGMEQPLYYWVPSIAPSGMSFYTGDKFPAFQDGLLVGSLKFQLLVHLQLEQDKVVKETRYLKGKLGRIRDVRTGSDGFIYLLTDAGDGRVIRLEPGQ